MIYTRNTGVVLSELYDIQNNKDSFWYVASAYSSPQKWLRYKRVIQAATFAGWLLQQGIHVYAPIPHTHTIAEMCDLPLGFEFWEKYDLHMIKNSCGVIVLCNQGYLQSVGVTRESSFCVGLNKPLFLGTRLRSENPDYNLAGPAWFDGKHYLQTEQEV